MNESCYILFQCVDGAIVGTNFGLAALIVALVAFPALIAFDKPKDADDTKTPLPLIVGIALTIGILFSFFLLLGTEIAIALPSVNMDALGIMLGAFGVFAILTAVALWLRKRRWSND